MSNLFDTGSETVNRMCRLQFTGNVIPSTWYHTIKKETGKPNLNAIIILADIVYWYRPVKSGMRQPGSCADSKRNSRLTFYRETISSWRISLVSRNEMR